MPIIRVLYVEDNALVREITSELLATEERHVIACGSAEEAFNEYQRGVIDVVITDMSLPAQSGLDLAKRILSIRHDARIVILSGYALSLPLEQLGPNVRAMIKPVQAQDVDAMIDDLLRGTAQRSISSDS